jgi:hypothetical protein
MKTSRRLTNKKRQQGCKNKLSILTGEEKESSYPDSHDLAHVDSFANWPDIHSQKTNLSAMHQSKKVSEPNPCHNFEEPTKKATMHESPLSALIAAVNKEFTECEEKGTVSKAEQKEVDAIEDPMTAEMIIHDISRPVHISARNLHLRLENTIHPETLLHQNALSDEESTPDILESTIDLRSQSWVWDHLEESPVAPTPAADQEKSAAILDSCGSIQTVSFGNGSPPKKDFERKGALSRTETSRNKKLLSSKRFSLWSRRGHDSGQVQSKSKGRRLSTAIAALCRPRSKTKREDTVTSSEKSKESSSTDQTSNRKDLKNLQREPAKVVSSLSVAHRKKDYSFQMSDPLKNKKLLPSECPRQNRGRSMLATPIRSMTQRNRSLSQVTRLSRPRSFYRDNSLAYTAGRNNEAFETGKLVEDKSGFNGTWNDWSQRLVAATAVCWDPRPIPSEITTTKAVTTCRRVAYEPPGTKAEVRDEHCEQEQKSECKDDNYSSSGAMGNSLSSSGEIEYEMNGTWKDFWEKAPSVLQAMENEIHILCGFADASVCYNESQHKGRYRYACSVVQAE